MDEAANTPKWLTVEEAWQRLAQAAPDCRQAMEQTKVVAALGRVLADAPLALTNVPPADNSAMDGFALSPEDSAASAPLTLPISQRIPAGTAPEPLAPGSAARIFTGSEIPPGADAVVMQENCSYDSGQVTVNRLPRSGANIRRCGEDIARGKPLLPAGHRVRPQDIGLLTAAGVEVVDVYRPLRVTLVATGDELAPPGQPLPPGKIYESNSPMVAALLTETGCGVKALRAPDDLQQTTALLQQAAEADAVITIGGVSVGEEDHVKTALNRLGTTDFWKIGLKPGKPFLLGDIAGKPLMGLPGNPVSAFVTFALFCRPFLRAMQGQAFTTPRHWPARAGFDLPKPIQRQQYLRATLATDDQGNRVVHKLANQSSAGQTSLCEADVLAVIPPETGIAKGEMIQVISLAELVHH